MERMEVLEPFEIVEGVADDLIEPIPKGSTVDELDENQFLLVKKSDRFALAWSTEDWNEKDIKEQIRFLIEDRPELSTSEFVMQYVIELLMEKYLKHLGDSIYLHGSGEAVRRKKDYELGYSDG
jgi:hypothetical protein